MIYKFILVLIPILIIGCTPQQSGLKKYEHERLGVQIAIPSNWKPISSTDAAQNDLVWEDGVMTAELSLGYFDPNTKEKVGIFMFVVGEQIESEEDMIAFEEGMADFNKIIWRNTLCYYCEFESEKTITRCYAIIHKQTAVGFVIGTKRSHENLSTNIINEIHF